MYTSWPKTQNLWVRTITSDIMVLALQRLTVLGLKDNHAYGNRWKQKKTFDETNIYVRLGTSRAAELPGFHCLTGCDTCGHIKGIGKKTAFKPFTEATPAELTELSQLGVEEMSSADVVSGCERFFVQALSPKKSYRPIQLKKIEVEALSEITWGIDKIPQLLLVRDINIIILRVYLCRSICSESRPCGISKYSRPFKVGWLFMQIKFQYLSCQTLQ